MLISTRAKWRLIVCLSLTSEPSLPDGIRPRVIATTDGEVDDRSSRVRFLMYSIDYEIVGIVENNSIFQKRGHSGSRWIQKQLELYAQVYPNLKKHHPDYPSPDYLKGDLCLGNENPADLQAGRLVRTVSPGETVHLDASPTSDPDGDKLTFIWWQYVEEVPL